MVDQVGQLTQNPFRRYLSGRFCYVIFGIDLWCIKCILFNGGWLVDVGKVCNLQWKLKIEMSKWSGKVTGHCHPLTWWHRLGMVMISNYSVSLELLVYSCEKHTSVEAQTYTDYYSSTKLSPRFNLPNSDLASELRPTEQLGYWPIADLIWFNAGE